MRKYHLDLNVFMKIKKCGEMARKLRYFKDQMSKAGLSSPAKLVTKPDIDVDELEVNKDAICLDKNAFSILLCLSSLLYFGF